jgi:hypothetical protein
MPFVKDFSTLRGRGTIELEVPKWSSPLYVEYGYDYISTQLYFFWRVQGTSHTFRLAYPDLMQLSGGDYEKHIAGFLKDFRLEYLGWVNAGFSEPWMREYHEEYKNFIEF